MQRHAHHTRPLLRIFFRPLLKRRIASRGLAVIMALSVVLIMSTAALELHSNERANMLNAAAMRDRMTLEQMTISGINLAMAVLTKDGLDSQTDSLQEDWADEETMVTYLQEIPFDQGSMTVKVIDELGKIQINALVQYPEGNQFNDKQRRVWDRLARNLFSIFELLGDDNVDLDETDPLTVINSIKDWLDKDEDLITGLSGAESDYYEELDPPYACKNAPFDHISEVRLVKGIIPELFNGLAGASGLGDYISVYGAEKEGDEGVEGVDRFKFSGRININTAELPVLQVLMPEENEEFANLLVDYRSAADGTQYTNDLTNINWYKNVPGFAGINLDADLISVSSNTFRIVATAELNGASATSTAIVRREREAETDPIQCKVLNWKTE